MESNGLDISPTLETEKRDIMQEPILVFTPQQESTRIPEIKKKRSRFHRQRSSGAILIFISSSIGLIHSINTILEWGNVVFYFIGSACVLILVGCGYFGSFFALQSRHFAFIICTIVLLFLIAFWDIFMFVGIFWYHVPYTAYVLIPILAASLFLIFMAKPDFDTDKS